MILTENFYNCPNCNLVHVRTEAISMNTFSARQFSDGKIIGPHYYEAPFFIRCSNCAAIFRCNEATRVAETVPGLSGSPRAEPLSQKGLLEALEKNVYESKNEEYYLRKHLLYTYNDPFRENFQFRGFSYRIDFFKNALSMIKMHDHKDLDELLFSAELYRLCGLYKLSIDLLNKAKDMTEDKYYLDFINENLERNFLLDTRIYVIS